MNDMYSLLRTNKYWRKLLKVHEQIIRKTRNNTIYDDQNLLQTVYQYHPNYVINWTDVKDEFIDDTNLYYGTEELKATDISNLSVFQTIFVDKIVFFKDWKEFDCALGFTTGIEWKGVFTLLALDQTLDPNHGVISVSFKGISGILQLLFENPKFNHKLCETKALPWISQLGHVDLLRVILEDGRIDPSAVNNSTIIMAAHFGHLGIVELLLQDPRVDPSVNNNAPIIMASGLGYIDVVRSLLLDPRVNPADEDNMAIKVASGNGHISVVELLLRDLRVDVTADGNWALAFAALNEHWDIVELLNQYLV
jgi:hypothetical protein